MLGEPSTPFTPPRGGENGEHGAPNEHLSVAKTIDLSQDHCRPAATCANSAGDLFAFL